MAHTGKTYEYLFDRDLTFTLPQFPPYIPPKYWLYHAMSATGTLANAWFGTQRKSVDVARTMDTGKVLYTWRHPDYPGGPDDVINLACTPANDGQAMFVEIAVNGPFVFAHATRTIDCPNGWYNWAGYNWLGYWDTASSTNPIIWQFDSPPGVGNYCQLYQPPR